MGCAGSSQSKGEGKFPLSNINKHMEEISCHLLGELRLKIIKFDSYKLLNYHNYILESLSSILIVFFLDSNY